MDARLCLAGGTPHVGSDIGDEWESVHSTLPPEYPGPQVSADIHDHNVSVC